MTAPSPPFMMFSPLLLDALRACQYSPTATCSYDLMAGGLIWNDELPPRTEWGSEAGQPWAARSEAVMHSAHALLQAASKEGSIESVIGPGSVRTFLGWEWVDAHPAVLPYIADLEAAQ